MTVISFPSLDEKRSNEGTHILHFEEDVSLKIKESTLKNPDERGLSFNVKFLADKKDPKRKKKLALKWCSKQHSITFICDPDRHFDCTTRICEKVGRVIAAFSDSMDTFGWKFTVIKPVIIACRDSYRAISVEPYIKNIIRFREYVNYEKYNSTVAYLLETLRSFSVKFSKGRYVFDNLKIGVDSKSKQVFMLPPALISKEEGRYGCEDTGKLDDIVSPICD